MILLSIVALACIMMILRAVAPTNDKVEGSPSPKTPHLSIQACIDEYTSRGSWNGDKWEVPEGMMNPECLSWLNTSLGNNEILSTIQQFKVGFMGDSTTRSDLRALEETFLLPRTNLDEASVFQKKHPNGTYICHLAEQSMNLTKCGIPPIINTSHYRYFYKVYPKAPLDQWYFSEVPHMFRDLDVVVISLGRWLVYHHWASSEELAQDINSFLLDLRKVYSGKIVYQSSYAYHTVSVEHATYPVPDCQHGLFGEYDCVQTVTEERPQYDSVFRSVMEDHSILYLDRWNISTTLPQEYYQLWLCDKPDFHSWSCDHHLYFVAMQHLRLVANVVRKILQ